MPVVNGLPGLVAAMLKNALIETANPSRYTTSPEYNHVVPVLSGKKTDNIIMAKKTINITLRILLTSLGGVILLPMSLGSAPDSIINRKRIVVRIQAFHTPISNAGISAIVSPRF